MFQTIDDGFAWLESFTNLEKGADPVKRVYRPDRMIKLLELCGNPQDACRVLHLAGSKGKGSTAVLLASALKEAGFKTGLYTSPHILHYRERIRINGEELTDEVYLRHINDISGLIRDLPEGVLPGGNDPTTFELLTLLGFLIFREQECDWSVIETGLGGRLDATNAVSPEGVILTPIEKEHTQWLGDTLGEIAGEKAGIIKPGRPAFSALQYPETEEVLKRKAEEQKAPFRLLGDLLDKAESEISPSGTAYTLYWKDGSITKGDLRMIGSIQAWNAALALTVLRTLLPREEEQTWIRGMSRAFLPARMEVLRENPLILTDGAHTPRSLELLLKDFPSLAGPGKGVLLFGCGDDKDMETMVRMAAPLFPHVVVTSPGFFKKSHPERIRDCFEHSHGDVHFYPDPAEAMEFILRRWPGEPVLATGSFFLSGEVSRFIRTS